MKLSRSDKLFIYIIPIAMGVDILLIVYSIAKMVG